MGVSTVNLFNAPSSLPNVPTNLASPFSYATSSSVTLDNSVLALVNKIPSNAEVIASGDSSNISKDKKPSFVEGLLKLALDTACTAITYYLTTTRGQSGEINISPKAAKIHNALGRIPNVGREKVKNLTEGIAKFGDKSTFPQYKKLLLENKEALIKEAAKDGLTAKDIEGHINEHIKFRKLIAGSSIALLSYLRTVLFAPNADWSHPDLFSPVACASLALPIVANSLYYYVYDIGKTFGSLTTKQSVDLMDGILDVLKAGNKAGRRYNPTGDHLANFLNGGVLFGAALFSRGMRNHLEDTVLSKMVPEIKNGPKSFRETFKTSSSRAMLKMLLDAPVFLLITKGAAMVIDSLMNTIHPYNREDTSQGVVSYFGSPTTHLLRMQSNGLTSKTLASA